VSRGDLVALGKRLVTERLASIGCSVTPPANSREGKLLVQTPSGRSLEVFVSTQRVGGYVFWTKRRLELASDRFAAIVLVDDGGPLPLYVVPTTEWRHAERPLVDRDNVGKHSEPEFGISLARSSLPALQRYKWDQPSTTDFFR
jgi:hypothetical protein